MARETRKIIGHKRMVMTTKSNIWGVVTEPVKMINKAANPNNIPAVTKYEANIAP